MLRAQKSKSPRTTKLPAVERGMAFFHRNENATTSCANFSATTERSFNRRAISTKIDNLRGKLDRAVRRRRSQKFNRVLGGHGARRMIRAGLFHQMISRGPI